jgi:hypothetical protein
MFCLLFAAISSAIIPLGAGKLLVNMLGVTRDQRARSIGNATYVRPFPSISSLLNYDAESYRVKSIPGLAEGSFPTQHWAGQIPVPYAGENHYGSLFFWLFEPVMNISTAPIVIWLNGGPGLHLYLFNINIKHIMLCLQVVQAWTAFSLVSTKIPNIFPCG